MRKGILLFAAVLGLNLHVFADIISGTVVDSATGNALDSVRVSCGSVYVAYSASNGTFSLNIGSAVLPYRLISIKRDAKISYTVSNLQGRLVVKNSLNQLDFARMPHGIYMVTEKATDGQQVSYKVSNLLGTIATNFPDIDHQNRNIVIAAATKADTVAFATAGYLSTQRITSGSQSGIMVKLQKAPVVSGMRYISGGTFQMGSANSNLYASPVHSVTISSFYMDSTDVTQASYQALMGVNPSYFDTGVSAPRKPVESMNWYDAVLYCNARSKHDGYDTVYSYGSKYTGSGYDTLAGVVIDYTKHGYRLPTEAEWEYACRAGSTADFYWGQSYPPQTSADTASISAHAWWYYNSPNGTQPVATKPSNAFGLYDMSGNVWQWCNDWYGSYSSGSQTDPAGPSTGSSRVLRGGSWYDLNLVGVDLCAACRGYHSPNLRYNLVGFRCVRR